MQIQTHSTSSLLCSMLSLALSPSRLLLALHVVLKTSFLWFADSLTQCSACRKKHDDRKDVRNFSPGNAVMKAGKFETRDNAPSRRNQLRWRTLSYLLGFLSLVAHSVGYRIWCIFVADLCIILLCT